MLLDSERCPELRISNDPPLRVPRFRITLVGSAPVPRSAIPQFEICNSMPSISTKPLAALCRRVAVSLESGIDERRIWQREAERAGGRMRVEIGRIHAAVAAGQGISDGIRATGSYFPPLFRALAGLGEQTGKSPAVFRRLADHFEHRVTLRRDFLAGITWPAIQLTAAVLIVGFLIWILGMIAERRGPTPYDILGLGLQGGRGLVLYVAAIGTCILLGFGAYFVIRSGAVWTRGVQRLAFALPGIGTSLQTLALSRLAWSLGLSLEAGMDIRKAVPFSLRTTQLDYYARHAPDVVTAIDRGDDLFTALAGTGVLPDDFLDALQVGEQSGRMDEMMLRLADQYQERARAALKALTVLAGFAVWAFVALLIVLILVRLVSSYSNFLQDLSRPGG